MRIKALGCSGGIGAGRRTTSLLVDGNVLIDAGTGVGDLSLAELGRISDVFLTHAHLDHIAGLPLFLDTAYDREPGRSIRVHGRRETIDALGAHIFNGVIWPDFLVLPDTDSPIMRYNTLAPEDIEEIAGTLVQAVEVHHSVPSLGYSIQRDDRVFAFSGDTQTNRTLWSFLNTCPRLDVLLIEVSFPNSQASLAMASGHYCAKTMARDLQRLSHRPEIWITSMKPGAERIIHQEVRDELPERDVHMLEQGAVIRL